MKLSHALIAAAMAALLAGSALAGAFAARALERHNGSTASTFMDTQRGHLSRLDGASLPGRVVFLGSSTFQGLDVSAVTPFGLNLGLGGDTLPGLVKRAEQYRALGEAHAVFINIGLNDLMQQCRLPDMPLSTLLSLVPPPTPVIVAGTQGVAPSQHGERCSEQINTLVTRLNQQFASVCAQRHGCTFVSHPITPGVDSPEIRQLQDPDGIHLSANGYRVLIDRLRKVLYTIEPALAAQAPARS